MISAQGMLLDTAGISVELSRGCSAPTAMPGMQQEDFEAAWEELNRREERVQNRDILFLEARLQERIAAVEAPERQVQQE